jgi:RHS Repeat.
MDFRDRKTVINDAASPPIVQYNYDLSNRVLNRTYRNGTAANYTYNSNDWIMSLEHTRSATRIAGFGHAYDKEGNKRFEEKRHDSAFSETYGYDAINRLVDYKVTPLVGVPRPVSQISYDLDEVGNWKNKITDRRLTETRTHNAANEITSIAGVPLINDDNGNLAEDPLYRYAYDEENRLLSVTRKSDNRVLGQYHYDALGRRVVKVANTSGTPMETRYFHDDERIIEEQNAAGATRATYTYGNYIDEALTMERGGQTYYYHQNALWSVAAITNSAGTIIERYRYDAYGGAMITDAAGNPLGNLSAIGNPWMFTGRELDAETGLYFYRARYLDSSK